MPRTGLSIPESLLGVVTAYAFAYQAGRTISEQLANLFGGTLIRRKILILGAFGGRDWVWLREAGADVDIFDLGHHDFARSAFVGDANDAAAWAQVTDASYDAIVACDVLEHLQNDAVALVEIKKKLNSAGKLVVSVPYNHSVESTHLRSYGEETLVRLLSACGFQVSWRQHRPRMLATSPHFINVFNYGCAVILDLVGFGAQALHFLLKIEYAIDHFHELPARFFGRGMQAGVLAIAVPCTSSNIGAVAANRAAFLPNPPGASDRGTLP
jgi:SAM-dependent methyltransferase